MEILDVKINSTIYEEIKRNNGMVTTSRVTKLGYSRTLLYNYAKNGLLERCRHGIYILPGTAYDDTYVLMFCTEKIAYSHETALYLNGLSETRPSKHIVTIPNNEMLPNSLQKECTCYYVKPELHDVGLISPKTAFGNQVRCYNVERTICDILRSRNRVGEETVASALQSYAAYEKKDLELLAEYAKQFRVTKVMKKYLKGLL